MVNLVKLGSEEKSKELSVFLEAGVFKRISEVEHIWNAFVALYYAL